VKLEVRTAVVTGAGSGIGRATSLLFAREGARVFAVDLDGLAVERMAAEAEGDATGMQCDVRDEAAVKDLFAR
jgi:NAD(P)-dependent dehydrogenase (short-subunit alcohol dehydrogenase family)